MSAYWHKADMPVAARNVRFRGKSGHRNWTASAAVLLNKVSVAKTQRVLMRIEAGCPDSLKRLTGVIFVPLTFRIERS